mmetsp:Transcript_27820/g.83439  ORF Transcript_27820/g.83439 Transcript_27820/m.83439 type:complete len:262 (+) Transcript_27820:1435-2220(+)
MARGDNFAVVVMEGLFAALCIILVLVNVRHSHGCGAGKSDAELRRLALEHRLEAMETEVRENSQHLHALLERMETRFGVSGLVDFREVKRECHAEASVVVSHLAEDHPPPMPQFAEPDAAGRNADDAYVDDVLREGGGDDRYGAEFNGGGNGEAAGEPGSYDDRVVDLPSTEVRTEKCRQWRTEYAVSPGASWGTLPLDLQQTWRDYDCDIFVQDAVQGMMAGAAEHQAREEFLESRPKRDDDDFDDDVVGEIESVEAGKW